MSDQSTTERIAELERKAKAYRDAIATVCEGWTLPCDARKILETALWPHPETESRQKEDKA